MQWISMHTSRHPEVNWAKMLAVSLVDDHFQWLGINELSRKAQLCSSIPNLCFPNLVCSKIHTTMHLIPCMCTASVGPTTFLLCLCALPTAISVFQYTSESSLHMVGLCVRCTSIIAISSFVSVSISYVGSQLSTSFPLLHCCVWEWYPQSSLSYMGGAVSSRDCKLFIGLLLSNHTQQTLHSGSKLWLLRNIRFDKKLWVSLVSTWNFKMLVVSSECTCPTLGL